MCPYMILWTRNHYRRADSGSTANAGLTASTLVAQPYTVPPRTSIMSNYDQLHRQCRTLENLFDSKLTSYSQLASSLSRPGRDIESSGSSERWKDLEVELDDLSVKLEEINKQLAALAGTPELMSASMLRAIQRHRELQQDGVRELKRTKANVKHAFDQANLLSGVRNDIDAYKSSAADSLLAERNRIDNSHSMTDDIIEQAYEARSEFSRQRTSLASINTRIVHVIGTMPGINNLVSMIKTRRRRDSIIIGVLVGFCTIIILTYLWH